MNLIFTEGTVTMSDDFGVCITYVQLKHNGFALSIVFEAEDRPESVSIRVDGYTNITQTSVLKRRVYNEVMEYIKDEYTVDVADLIDSILQTCKRG